MPEKKTPEQVRAEHRARYIPEDGTARSRWTWICKCGTKAVAASKADAVYSARNHRFAVAEGWE